MAVVAMIGIGDSLSFPSRNEIEQERHACSRTAGAQCQQIGEIVRIQCNDMVEAVEIGGAHLPRPLAGNVDAFAEGSSLRATIRRLPDVPVAGAGGIDLDFQSKPPGLGPKRAFGER